MAAPKTKRTNPTNALVSLLLIVIDFFFFLAILLEEQFTPVRKAVGLNPRMKGQLYKSQRRLTSLGAKLPDAVD